MSDVVVRWVVIAALLVAVAVALNALFPPVRGRIAMGVAAGLLFVAMYGVGRVRE